MTRIEVESACKGVPWWSLAIVFGFAWVLRTFVALHWPSLHHPDELFQALEQAHRLVFGTGLVPWEFRDGARSWLLPGLLGGALWLGETFAPGTDAYRVVAVGGVAALSASTVVVAWHWARPYGLGVAAIVVTALATWPDLVYFGARPFGEVVAAAFLFAGACLCSGRSASARRWPWLPGVVLGCAVAFRFHLAPAALVAAAWHCRLQWRSRWWPLCLGGIAPLCVLGLVDWATWGVPFGSVLRNFAVNIFEARSHRYGVSGATWYVHELWRHWGWALPVLGGLALVGARREPLSLVVALVVVLVHSAVAHKEYRFVFPALPLFVFVAALGSARLASLARPWLAARAIEPATPVSRTVALALTAVAWVATSATLVVSDTMRAEWSRGRAGLVLLQQAGHEARCGVALQGLVWAWSGGHAWLHAPLPLYELPPGADPRAQARAFDAWLAPAGNAQPRRHGYALRRCEPQRDGYVDEVCLWTRAASPCHPGTAVTIQQGMEARGE